MDRRLTVEETGTTRLPRVILAVTLLLGEPLAAALPAPVPPPSPGPASPASIPAPDLSDPVEKARALFERYVALERDLDPSAADLYSDEALIRTLRVLPTGEEKVLTIPAPQYKQILRRAMPLVRPRKDGNTYAGTCFYPEGGRVRIITRRRSGKGKAESPLSLLVGPAESGTWIIFEESSVSRDLSPPPRRKGKEISVPDTPR